jgi:hypothetical protein
MSDDLTLSQQVQNFLDTLDSYADDGSAEERQEASSATQLVVALVDDIIASREMVTDNRLAVLKKKLEDTPQLIEHFLDERSTRDAITAVRGNVQRTLQLSRLEGSHIPSKITNRYLQEAARTYTLGLPQASVALCRAALEQALKENLGYQGTGTFVKMEDLLDEAQSAGVIDGFNRKIAIQIADEADDVLHEKPVDSSKAFAVLLALRGVLKHVYSD